MNVLFLDIDGVLVTSDSLNNGYSFDKRCVNLLNTLFDQVSDLKIVISSSWRIGNSINNLKNVFKSNNFNYINNIIDKTPVRDKTRGHEINLWLQDNDCDKFVILDDESDMDNLISNLVKTNFDTGLTEAHIKIIIDKLTR